MHCAVPRFWYCRAFRLTRMPVMPRSSPLHGGLRCRVVVCALYALLLALSLPAHAAESVLYEKNSAFGPVIVTEDEKGLRTLRFEKGGARQSVVKPGDPDHLELPYARSAFAGLALSAEPGR